MLIGPPDEDEIFPPNFKSILANTIQFVDVNAKGSGASYTEALNNSLSNAVAKVNGRSIETQTTLSKISEIINTESDNTYYSSNIENVIWKNKKSSFS